MPRKGQEKPKLSVLPCWGFNQQPTPWLYLSAMPELAEVPWVKILTRHARSQGTFQASSEPTLQGSCHLHPRTLCCPYVPLQTRGLVALSTRV